MSTRVKSPIDLGVTIKRIYLQLRLAVQLANSECKKQRGCCLPWAAGEKGWKRGGTARKASCADRWHSDFRFSDRKQRLNQSRRLTAMRLRFSSDIKWFNTWLCKTLSKRVSLCLQPSRNPLRNYLKYWHPLWAFIPSPSGCSQLRLFPCSTLHLEHTCTGSCVSGMGLPTFHTQEPTAGPLTHFSAHKFPWSSFYFRMIL